MIVTCESCDTRFELDDDLVSESGSDVKCSKCNHTFKVYRPASVHEPEGPSTEELEETLDLNLDEDQEEPDQADLDINSLDFEAGPEDVLDFDLLDAEEKPAGAELNLDDLGLEEDSTAQEFTGMEGSREKQIFGALDKETAAGPVDIEPEESPDDISKATLMASAEPETQEVRAKPFAPPVTPAAQRSPAPRKAVGTPVLIFLVIGLLAGSAFGVYSILSYLDIRIPFLESFMGGAEITAVDPGNLHIALPDKYITGRFVENRKAGRLFVIQGKARNDYDQVRSFIVVKAVLYSTKEGKEIVNQIGYCGNVFSDNELRSLDRAVIEEKLHNKFGHERSNFRIPPAREIPFVFVFFDVPKDVGEFAVEVVSSLPAQ
jgi:predicted Zn finger-like uncharacterized protein